MTHDVTSTHDATGEVVTVETADRVATVTLGRPDKLGALDRETRWELTEALRGVASDPDVRAVVLTGTGRAFCAGQDLERADELVHANETVAGSYNPIVHAIVDMPKPVVAAVNGLAVGAGMGLALAADLRVASEAAIFVCGFGKVGLVPDSGVSWFLVRELGHARAFEIATSGRPITAEEAHGLGLLNEVVPAEDLLAQAQSRATALAAGPSLSIALTKRQFRLAAELSLEATMAVEARHQGVAGAHPDHPEGRSAFREKRHARWA